MKQSEQLYIPVEVVRFILDHRRRRLAAEARTGKGDLTPPSEAEQTEYNPNDHK